MHTLDRKQAVMHDDALWDSSDQYRIVLEEHNAEASVSHAGESVNTLSSKYFVSHRTNELQSEHLVVVTLVSLLTCISQFPPRVVALPLRGDFETRFSLVSLLGSMRKKIRLVLR